MATYDLFTVGGQSNAVGRGDSSSSPSLTAGTALEYLNSTDSLEDPLADPVQGNGDAADTGSAWPSFCETYISSTGNNIAIVGTAKGGTAQASGADGGSGNWDTTGSLQGDAVTRTNNAISKLQTAGHTVNYRGILWHQGERDAQDIDGGGITKSTYKSALQTMISDFRSDLSRPNLPFYIFELGQPNSGDTSGFQDVRDAQNEVATATADVYVCSSIQKDFPAQGKMLDNLHYNQTGLNEMGTEGANFVSSQVSPSSSSAYVVQTSSTYVVQTSSTYVVQTAAGDSTAPTISNYSLVESDTTAPTISNYSLTGTEAPPRTTLEDFESGNVNAWTTPTGWGVTTTAADVWEGTYAGYCTGGEASNTLATLSITDQQYSNLAFRHKQKTLTGLRPHIRIRDSGGTYGPILAINDGSQTGSVGDVVYYNGTSWQTTNINTSTGSYYEIRLTNIDWSNHEYDIEVYDDTGSSVGSSTNAPFANNITSIADFTFYGMSQEFAADLIEEY